MLQAKEFDYFKWLAESFIQEKGEDALRCKENKQPGKALPVLGDPSTHNGRLALFKEIRDFLKNNFVYTADPVLRDWYTRPEVAYKFASSLDVSKPDEFKTAFKKNKLSFDCDDTAVMADRLLEISKYPLHFTVSNLVMPLKNHIFIDIREPYWWDHVICKAEFGKGYWVTIDTNGLRWFHEKSGDIDTQIRKRFARMYNTEYQYLLPVESPFRGFRI